MKKHLDKILVLISSILLVGFIITSIVLELYFNITFDIDESLIIKNENYNVRLVENKEYTTLAKFDSNGNILDDDFKILSFTDLHLDNYKDTGNLTYKFLIKNIVNEKPDMVIFLGDTITSSLNDRRTKQFAEVMESLGVYWASTLGNHEHDNFLSISRKRMLKIFSSYEHSLVDYSIKKTIDNKRVDGNHNYVINLMNNNGIYQSLYFIDSHQGMSIKDTRKYYNSEFTNLGCNNYDYIKESQIKWYEETVNSINGLENTLVKSTIFMHIPLPEYRIGYDYITGENGIDKANPFNNYEFPLERDSNILYSGKRREVICSSGHNSGLFNKIIELSSTKAIFCGHDHVNDFVIKYEGIILGYTQAGGYSTYNSLSKKEYIDGEYKSVEDHLTYGYSIYTYNQNGEISFESKLNYDLYPELNDEVLEIVRK